MANYGYPAMRHHASDAKPLPIVLVVDDDPDIRDTIAEVLSDEGYPVELACNGREALDVLETDRAKPGLILLDLMMPVLDGWGFMAELEKMPRLAAIPVVVFSAHSVDPDAIGALGARGFLRKPLQLQELLELVGRCALKLSGLPLAFGRGRYPESWPSGAALEWGGMRYRSHCVEMGFLLAVVLSGAGCKSTVDGGESAASGSPVGSDLGGGGGASGASPMQTDSGLPMQDAGRVDAGSAGRGGSGGRSGGSGAGSGAAAGSGGGAGTGAETSGGLDAAVGDAQTQPENTEPVIVVVGYQGFRIMSRDLGQTWEHQQGLPAEGADLDNPALLRAAAYGNGLFVAAGHHILTSPDGITWTERDNYGQPGTTRNQWLGGVAWGNDRFVAAGGYGESWYSLDGITWQAGGDRPGGNHAASRSLAFGNGEFRTASDGGDWWSSQDGESWEHHSSGHSTKIAFCEGDFRDREQCPAPWFGHDTYIEDAGWDGNTIRSSEDALNWHDVHVTYRGGIEDVAFGFGPAQ